MNPFGQFRLGELAFPAKSTNPMLAHIPEAYRDRPYEVFAEAVVRGAGGRPRYVASRAAREEEAAEAVDGEP